LQSTIGTPQTFVASAEADKDTPVKRIRHAAESATRPYFLRRLAVRATAAGGLLTLCVGSVWSQSSGGQEIASEGRTDKIEYVSVDQAMRALKQKPGASTTLTQPDGWTIIKEPRPTYTQWSFVPADHYAHPAVVRRAIKIADNGDVSIETTALCEAPQFACEKLTNEFRQLNARAKQSVQQRLRDPATR
jgi:hypothetical protein